MQYNAEVLNNLHNLSELMARYTLDVNDIAEIAGCTPEEAEQIVYHRKRPSEAVYDALAGYFKWDSVVLKECPFCGGAAELMPAYHGSTKVWCVTCRNCLATSMTNEIPSIPVRYWNKRAGSACSRYFSNTECEYYPCHAGAKPDNFNCLFCYCPLYGLKDCGGNPQYLPNGIKDCSDCLRPHENYDAIIARLREEVKS